jgi:hypothetical protein
LAIGGASYLATRKGKELSAKLRLRELALGAGTRIRHIPLTERKNIVERLSKIIGEKPPALEGRVPPRMIRVEDKDFILHYRGANKSRDLKRPYRRFRESIEAIQSFEPPRNMNFKEKQKHFREATSKRDREDWAMANTIGTSTNPQIAKHFRKNHSGSRPGMVGVYATPIEKIPQRIQEGKIGFPGRGHPSRNHWEQEISQQNGGNLVKVRQYRSIDEDNADDVGLPVKTVRGVSESRRIRDLSAKLRLRELARGDYAIPALGKMLKDRSFLEEFLTGKRGPKLGDLRHNFNGGIFTESSKLAGHIPGLLRPIGVGTGISRWGSNARQKGRDAIAKIIRKGRAGGDVYEEIVRS